MKCFHCDSCGMMTFFTNDACVKCGHALGFLPDVLDLSALEATPNDQWQAASAAAKGKLYRKCDNGKNYQTCNWMVPVADPNPLCLACRLNAVIPNLADRTNLERWSKLESAKHRCIYTFLKLKLPMESHTASDGVPLSFQFLQDTDTGPVKTGHEDGVITVNIAEADGVERERLRQTFHEPYRTLVGHFRHESGHYYWDRLIANSSNLKSFRELFGDEQIDYGLALKNYYEQGPSPDWPARTVTAYASSHPWEDWAETWAHYLHIMDSLETAASFGVSVNTEMTVAAPKIKPVIFHDRMNFDDLLAEWIPLTCALNSLNRGMGLADLYPFVIPAPVTEKLRFIHKVITAVSLQPLKGAGA